MKRIMYWAFEGNEGTGKTTLSKKFAERCTATWTYEPNAESEELKFLRELALNENPDIPNFARENALLTNRIIHHHNTVTPLLSNMSTVVTDRSFLSGMVYANLKSYTFDKFCELSRLSNINLFPDVIIYCRNKERRIVKNKNDIYDNACKDTHAKIDDTYEAAIQFIKQYIHTKHIKVIEFDNDFGKSVDENLDLLIKNIKEVCCSDD